MAGNDKLIDIDVLVKHETTKARLVNDGIREAWVPKSEFHPTVGDRGTLTLPTWLAQDKGLI